MREYEQLFRSFEKLGLDEKRDAFNEELLKVTYIIKNYLNKYNYDIIEDPYNYQKVIDTKLTESQLLNLNYKNIYYIKSELLMLISIIEGENNGN